MNSDKIFEGLSEKSLYLSEFSRFIKNTVYL